VIIHDRNVAGLAAAWARGRTGGCRPKLTQRQRQEAQRMYDSGEHTVEQIGQVLGVSRTTTYRAAHGRARPRCLQWRVTAWQGITSM
jgi:hypothetical protein